MTSPLDGILVADFSRVLAGPLATVMLADLGATVIKVERPGVGDDTRAWGPPWGTNSSTYFECANRSKRSVTLDLHLEEDRALAHVLAARADVLVENFKPGRLSQFGLDYRAVRNFNPELIYCSISGFGSSGGADLPGYDFLAQAMGGLMSITGEGDGPPMKTGVALVDVLTSKDATIGILAALATREQTGVGEHIEVNLLSSLLGSMANQASSYLGTRTSPARLGNAHPSIAPYEPLQCADGEIAVACGNDRQFRSLVRVLGVEHLADDPLFANNSTRVEHRQLLKKALEARLVGDTVMVWFAKLTGAGVPAGTVGDVESAFRLAQSLGLSPTVDVGTGHTPQVRHPITYSATSVATYRPPPRLGEHDTDIRRWLSQPGQEHLS